MKKAMYLVFDERNVWHGTYSSKEDADDMIEFYNECDIGVNEHHQYSIRTEMWED